MSLGSYDVHADPAGMSGEGTDADPLMIMTPADLNSVRYMPDAHFKLGDDINLIDSVYASWEPIPLFNGSLDGDDHKISGVTVNLDLQDNAGFFSEIGSSAVIKNLHLTQTEVTGN